MQCSPGHFGLKRPSPTWTSWPLRQNKRGDPFFSVDECVVVQNESHQNLTESIFMIGFKKNMHFWGSQISLGTQDSIKVVGSRGDLLKGMMAPHPTASHLHPKSGFQPESLQFPHEVSRISNVRTGSHSGKPVDQIPTCKPGILKLQLGEGMGCVHKSILSHHSAKGHNGSCNPNKSRAHRKRCYS